MPSSSTHSCYFSNCCFCIDLRTGCFILAYFNLVGAIISTISAAIGLGTFLTSMSNRESRDENEMPMIIGVALVVILFVILNLAFSIVFVVGLHKDKPGYVKSYLIYDAIIVGIYATIFIIGIIILTIFVGIDARFIRIFILTIIVAILYLSWPVYTLLVIRSYYIDMKNNGNRRTGKI